MANWFKGDLAQAAGITGIGSLLSGIFGGLGAAAAERAKYKYWKKVKGERIKDTETYLKPNEPYYNLGKNLPQLSGAAQAMLENKMKRYYPQSNYKWNKSIEEE